MLRAVMALVVWGALACAQVRPASEAASPVEVADAGVSVAAVVAVPKPEPLPSDRVALEARAKAAFEARELPGHAEESGQAYEELAARSDAPVDALLNAARARRFAAEALARRSLQAAKDALPGARGAELSSAAAREAQACAADARKAWTQAAPKSAAAFEQDPSLASLAEVPASAAEPLLLDGVCTALWARTRGFVALAERRDELKAVFTRVGALDPRLDDAAADRHLGALLAQLPAYAGGDLREAKAHFERALSLAPGSSATRVLYARTVAVKQLDRALFDRLLAEAQKLPARGIEDRAAQAEALELSQRADALFGGE